MIKKSSNIAETAENNNGCEFCGRTFRRATTVYNHICENKRRWLDRDRVGNRIGFNSWLQFYARGSSSNAKRTYLDFTKSAYYLAFVKFGNYCSDIGVLNPSRYIDWLLRNKVRIDTWTSDVEYTKYLCSYLREEDPYDALTRSVTTTEQLSKEANVQCHDVLRWANKNSICYAITTGKISPWMLYQSRSGVEFLDKLDQTQIKMIFDYINPELWAVTFKRNDEHVASIKQLLEQAGY